MWPYFLIILKNNAKPIVGSPVVLHSHNSAWTHVYLGNFFIVLSCRDLVNKMMSYGYYVSSTTNWAASSKFVSSSIPSWQILTAHAQPFRGARDLAFCLKVPLDSLLVWAGSGGSGETAWMRRLAWTFTARIGDKYQIRLTRPNWHLCRMLTNFMIFVFIRSYNLGFCFIEWSWQLICGIMEYILFDLNKIIIKNSPRGDWLHFRKWSEPIRLLHHSCKQTTIVFHVPRVTKSFLCEPAWVSEDVPNQDSHKNYWVQESLWSLFAINDREKCPKMAEKHKKSI